MPQAMQLVGVEQAIANLAQLPRKVAFKHLRIALSAAGGTIRDAARVLVPTDSHLLKKSLAVKAKIPDQSWNIKHHGKPAYVVIGSKRGFVGPVVVRKGRDKVLSNRAAVRRVLSGLKVLTRRPARYSHLAEKAKPYLGPASRTAGPAASQRAAQKLAKAFETEAALLPK